MAEVISLGTLKSPYVCCEIHYAVWHILTLCSTVLGKLETLWTTIVISLYNREVATTMIAFEHGPRRKMRIFPQYALRECRGKKFIAVIKVTAWLIEHASKNMTTTVRDMYYRDIDLFQGNQNNANHIITMMMESLRVTMDDLKLYPSQKGLVHYMSHTELVPITFCHWLQKAKLVLNEPEAIVILEKDAVFQALVAYLEARTNIPNLLLITGKGYPDRLTLRFTLALHLQLLHVPVLGFVDSDVYGISIMNQYYLHHIPVIHCGTYVAEFEGRVCQTISERDARLAICLLNRWDLPDLARDSETNPRCAWKRELCRGLVLRKKSEMNVVSTNVSEFIMRKVVQFLCPGA